MSECVLKTLPFGVCVSALLRCFADLKYFECPLGGPLNRLNAILSLLQPLDRYRAASAIASAIRRPYLALSRFHAKVGALNRLVLNRFRGSTAR